MAGSRVLVSDRYGTTPLSIYLPGARSLPRNQRVVSTRELDFVFLRRAHAGAWAPNEDSLFSPLAPGSPGVDPLPRFRLIAARRSAAYATYRFLAPGAVPITVDSLRRAFGFMSGIPM